MYVILSLLLLLLLLFGERGKKRDDDDDDGKNEENRNNNNDDVKVVFEDVPLPRRALSSSRRFLLFYKALPSPPVCKKNAHQKYKTLNCHIHLGF